MSNVKHAYLQSEKRLAPKRPCPDCGTIVRPTWGQPWPSFEIELDPTVTAYWNCPRGCRGGRDF
ncbi:hypothetical protein AB0909_00925 [Streptomyces albidoflavus]|uniref:hypothetical protein n=1 Tax=Streptomyces albidoflavus TaxID=1886 RepID=UPI0034552087